MNKMAVFFTLSAVLILSTIIFLIVLNQTQESRIRDINIQYLKHEVISDYVVNMEKNYLPTLIESSEKFAIDNMSEQVVPIDSFVDNLTRTIMGNNSLMNPENTLPAMINKTFNAMSSPIVFTSFYFEVTNVTQLDEFTLRVKSHVQFRVESNALLLQSAANFTWTDSLNLTNDLKIYGFTHPDYIWPISSKYENNTLMDCYLKLLDDTYNCKTVEGISPIS